MITASDFHHLVEQLGEQAIEDIRWSEDPFIGPKNAQGFAEEAIFVICNSGMRNTVARGIFRKCVIALHCDIPVIDVFKHVGKAAAIEKIWAEREALWDGFNDALGGDAELAYLESLPWIGPITKYHLAKNLGANVAKPDVHLQRLADREGCTAQQLCDRLAKEVRLRAATVDVVLWRACANGVLDSRTGVINGRSPAV